MVTNIRQHTANGEQQRDHFILVLPVTNCTKFFHKTRDHIFVWNGNLFSTQTSYISVLLPEVAVFSSIYHPIALTISRQSESNQTKTRVHRSEHTHLNPSLSWKEAPIMLSPRLAIWEASTHTAASGGVICAQEIKRKRSLNHVMKTSLPT